MNIAVDDADDLIMMRYLSLYENELLDDSKSPPKVVRCDLFIDTLSSMVCLVFIYTSVCVCMPTVK